MTAGHGPFSFSAYDCTRARTDDDDVSCCTATNRRTRNTKTGAVEEISVSSDDVKSESLVRGQYKSFSGRQSFARTMARLPLQFVFALFAISREYTVVIIVITLSSRSLLYLRPRDDDDVRPTQTRLQRRESLCVDFASARRDQQTSSSRARFRRNVFQIV